MSKTNLRQLLNEIGQHINVKEVPSDISKYVYEVDVDGLLYVNMFFWEDKNSVVFFTNLCEVPEDRKTEIFQ